MKTETVELFSIPPFVLKALLIAAATQDVRYYLNGVHVDTVAKRLVTTDGHRALIKRLDKHTIPEGFEPFTIPREAVEKVLKLLSKKNFFEIACDLIFDVPETDEEREALTHQVEARGYPLNRRVCLRTFDGAQITAPEIDGRFPDYGRIVPRECSNEPGQFNPTYLQEMAEAFHTASGCTKRSITMATVHHNGLDRGALVTCSDPSIIGVVMPWRAGDIVAEAERALIAFGFKQAPAETESPPAIETPITGQDRAAA